MWHDREMVESLFDEESNDPVRVEDEVCPLSIFVTDHREEGY